MPTGKPASRAPHPVYQSECQPACRRASALQQAQQPTHREIAVNASIEHATARALNTCSLNRLTNEPNGDAGIN